MPTVCVIVLEAFLVNRCHCCGVEIRRYNSSYKGFAENGVQGQKRERGLRLNQQGMHKTQVRLICALKEIVKASRPEV